MLSKFRKSEEGFTLIELLIVVAIIGILAAIAIPQFAAYRQRAFNGSAQSDLRNAKTAQESLFADNETYGVSEDSVDLTAVAGTLAGITTGPQGAATGVTAGAALAGLTVRDRIAGIGFALSNGVTAISYTSNTAALDNLASVNYLMYAKHSSGPRVFGVDSESTGIFMVENQAWTNGETVLASATLVTAPTGADNLTGATGGGLPTDAWSMM